MLYYRQHFRKRVLIFLLGERKWQHQNVKLLLLNAQNAKKEVTQLKRTLLQIQRELKSTNTAQDATNALNTKKQNNLEK